MPHAKSGLTAYWLKITLTGSKPAVWRRFVVPGEISLDRLHDVIQIVMGWEDSHLHSFQGCNQRYTEAPEDIDTEGQEEEEHRLCDVVPRVKSKFEYEYDFGDGWRHTLVVEGIKPVPPKHCACIMCLEGKRSCPPEDVGGLNGYEEFLGALKDPAHPEHASYKEWCGGSFDANAFDAEAVNLELLRYVRWSRPRRLEQELFAKV